MSSPIYRVIMGRMILALLLVCAVMMASVTDAIGGDTTQQDIAINQVSLLLPYTQSKHNVFYRLEAMNGCFEWTTNNPDLISLDTIYLNQDDANSIQQQQQQQLDDLSTVYSSSNQKRCSKSVLVGVKGSFGDRQSTLIIAEEQSTGLKLRCEVFVDKISTISIKSTTRTMYKDSVEVLEVLALDAQGNIFSTSVGVEFEWTVSSGNILQIVPFKDYKLINDPILLSMEQKSLQSSQVLVQGIDTGRADITVRLTESLYKDIKPTSVIISVLEPLSLNPSHLLYVIPGTQIQYILQSEKRNIVDKIPMPNPQYIWSTSNGKVGVVDNTGLFMAIDFGKTDLLVQHKNMSENRAHTIVHVVNPSYLALKVEPINLQPGPVVNWNLIEGKNYTLIVELYDASGHKIYNSDISYDVDIPKDCFKPIPPPSNKGSDTFYVNTIKDCITTVKATLTKVYDPKIQKFTSLLNPITVEQELVISPQIKVRPSNLYLPFIGKNSQRYQMKATGGTGDYNWLSSNRTMIEIDNNGLVSTTFRNGESDIVVVDRKNPHNRDKSHVFITEPKSLGFIPGLVEVEIGQYLPLHTRVNSPDLIEYDSCSLPDLNWRSEDSQIFTVAATSDSISSSTPPPPPQSCSTKRFMALREGNSLITVEYPGMEQQLRAETRIFAYPPLSADKDNILVSLGSSVDITHKGGPDPWYLEPKSHFQSIEAVTPGHVDIQSINSNTIRITCLAHTKQTLTLRVGNKPTSTNPHPAVSTVSIQYSCQPPKSVKLFIDEEKEESYTLSDQDKARIQEMGTICSGSLLSINEQTTPGDLVTNYKIRNNREIPFIVHVYDDNGNLFTNHSSLQFKWDSKNNQMAKWSSEKGEKGTKVSHHTTNRLSLYDQVGTVTLVTSIIGYNQDVLKALKIKDQPLGGDHLRHQLDLDLLSNVQLIPAQSTLYLSSKNQLTLEAVGGSKNFLFTSNNTKIAQLENKSGSPLAKITPLLPGYLQIDVKDICLGGGKASTPAYVYISDVGSIKVQVDELLPVGQSIPLEITALAANGHPFDQDQYQYINLVPHVDNPSAVEVIPNHNDPRKYTIKALDSGVVSVSFASRNPQTGSTIMSRPAQITVFPPFRISPQHLHLVPGSHFQIQPVGGVQRQTVTFVSTDPSIASIGRDIVGELVANRIGECTIIATSVYIDKETGKKTHIGEDKLVVSVKNMTGINLHSTINRLVVGNEMKLRVIGESGETPFTYGTVDLLFGWECLDSKVVQLLPIYSSANTSVEMESSFSVRVVGKQAGTTQIQVYAYYANNKAKRVFQSPPFQVTVVHEPAYPTHSVLLAPNTQYYLSDLHALEYHSLDYGSTNHHPHSICNNQLQLTPDNNKVMTNDRTGACYLEVTRDGRTDTTSLLKISTKLIAHLELIPLDANSMVLPIGSTTSFGIYLRDDLGELFTDYGSANKPFEMELSTSGVIGVSVESGNVLNGQPPVIISITPTNVGVVTLRVYLKGSKNIDDYIKIYVGRLIEPESPVVHLGGSLSLSIATKLLTMRGYSLPAPGEKIWASSDPSIISIDAVSGKATASKTQSGLATISYTRNPSSQTHVRVSQVAFIELQESGSTQTISSVSREQYTYPLRFYSQDHQEFTLESVEHNFECRCSILESQYASATCVRGTTPTTYQNYQCVVSTRPQPSTDSIIDHLTLGVSVSNSEKSYIFERTFNLTYENSFKVLYHSENQLTPQNPQLKLRIQSSGPLFVESDTSLVSITQLPQPSPSNIYEFVVTPVTLDKSFPSTPIYISNQGTKTKHTIHVSYSTDSSQPIPTIPSTSTSSSTPSSAYDQQHLQQGLPHQTIINVSIAVVIAFIGFCYIVYSNQKPHSSIQVNSTPIRGGSVVPQSPYRSPIPPAHFPSPRSQQQQQQPIPLNFNSSTNDSIYLSQTGRSPYSRF